MGMKPVGILCASEEELAPFLQVLQEECAVEKAMLTFHQGMIGTIRAVAVYSGVCKVNAAIAAQLLVDAFQTACIINAGTAGAVAEHLHCFDTVIATKTAYYDVEQEILTEYHPWMPSAWFPVDGRLLELSRELFAGEQSVAFGPLVSGEQFVEGTARAAVQSAYAPLAADMETAGVANVCYVNKVPFFAVRTITDTPDHEGQQVFEQNCIKASEVVGKITLRLLHAWEEKALAFGDM